MNSRTTRVALWAACLTGCSAPAAPDPQPPVAAESAAEPASEADEGDIEDEGERRAKHVQSVVAGTRAPAPAVELLDGGTLALAEVVGRKPVYVKFWATWCVPCREQMPHFEAVHQRHGDEMTVLAINVGLNETEDAVRAFREEHGLTMPIGYDRDGSIAQAFHNEVTPQHVVIDASGTVVYVGHQASDDLDQALATVLSQDPAAPTPPASTTPPPRQPSPQPLQAQLLDGTSFDLGIPREQPTVLSFVATWCDWYLAESRPAMSKACVAQQERLNALHQTLGNEAAFVGVALSLWTDETQLQGYRDRYGIEHPLALDRGARLFNHFGVRDVPTTIVLDRNGDEVFRGAGDPIELESVLRTQLAPPS